jgi:GNAT superfamily N-acetyltransferase
MADPLDPFELRRASVLDGAAVAAVFGAARAEMRYLPELHTAAEDLSFFAEQVLPTSHVTVAEVEGRIIGFSAVRADWLDHLYVRPEWQGRGVGGALLQRSMTESPAGLSLWAFLANDRARAFYARAGFVEVLRTDGSGNEERAPDVHLRWSGPEPPPTG